MRNRVLALILAFALAIPFFNIPAYAEYKEEILFRDIPWGSDYYKVKDDCSEFGEAWGKTYNCYYKNLQSIITDEPASKGKYVTYCRTECSFLTRSSLNVAGYPIEAVQLYYAFTDMDNPNLANTSFFLAEYKFENNATNRMTESEAFEVLEALKSKYGKYDKKYEYSHDGLRFDDYVILGANGTEVHFVLMSSATTFKFYSASIFYCDNEGLELSKNNYQYLKDTESINTDGL